MKIALVLDDTLDKPDGVQAAIITIGAWLRRQGHVVHYIVADTTRTDIPNVHGMGRFVNLRFNKNAVRAILPASARKIKTLLNREQFDVIHVMMPYSPLMGKYVVTHAGAKTAVIGTFHTLPASKALYHANHALSLVLGRSLRRFDAILAVSEPVIHFARKTYGLNATYLPNPIAMDDFKSGRRMGEYRRDKLNIMFLGRMVRRKGVIELIKAYNSVNEKTAKQTRLVIGGKGALRQKAKEMVGPDRNVIFAGFVSEKNKADFLATADIAVFPSTTGEAFGIVLIEAMAAGAGVVLGGNNPGYRSVLGAQPYLLFDPTDTKVFAEHLELFVNDSKMRDKMHAWQEEAVKQYDIGVVGTELVKLYQKALQERKDMR